MVKRKLLIMLVLTALVAGLGASCPAIAKDEAFPSKAITVVVYHSAGGGTDRMVRALAGNWPVYADVAMKIVNMPGGGSTDGAIFVRDARPDGYTLMAITSFMIPTPLSRPELNIGLENYRMLFNITTAPLMIIVPKDSPFDTLQKLIDYAKAHPGELKYGSSGTGGDLHIATEVFATKAGDLKFTHLPLEGGGEQLAMILGGHIDWCLGSFGSFLPSIKSGDTKALAVVDTQRHSVLPNVPTTIESGVNFLFPTFRGIAGPAGLSDERAAIIEGLGKQCLEEKGLISMIKKFGENPTYMAGEEYKKFMYDMRKDVIPVVERMR